MIHGKDSPKRHRRATSLLAILIGPMLLVSGFQASATGWKPNVREGSDIVMKDHRWPAWDQGTYYCFWYMSFVPKHPRLGNLYGGIAVSGPSKTPGMFMSYWGEVQGVHEGPYFYRHGYGAEGASGGAHGQAMFLRPGAWFRFVKRIIPSDDENEDHAHVGWWVKDLENDTWHTHSVVRLPGRATGFAGNSGFVEALAPETVPRAFERRLGYCRVGGRWHQANVVTGSGRNFFKLIENGTVLRYDRDRPDSAGGGPGEFTTIQPDVPELDKPVIAGATAVTHGDQVAVRWKIPPDAAPQLGYKIEVFGNPEATGAPLKVVEHTAPHILARRLDAGGAAGSVRLTVTGIFDQKTSVTIPTVAPPLQPAVKRAGMRPGLEYKYYEAPAGAEWEQLPEFETLTPVKLGHVGTLDDTVQEERSKLFALRYAGYLEVPADGLYVFTVATCDGSRLRLGGRVIADHDGVHGASARQHVVALSKGTHAFEMDYFKGPGRRHGGHASLADKLSVSWEGPGFITRRLSEGDFRCENAEGPALILALKGGAADGGLGDNLVEITARAVMRGHRPDKVQLCSGRKVLRTLDAADLDNTEDDLACRILFPTGRNRIHARLWYDGGHSVDSENVLEFETRELNEGPWEFTQLGHKFPIAVRSKDGSASFTGEGFYVGTQKVTGDFTLTARIADILLATRENGVHGANWLGLYTSNVGRPRKDQGPESTFNQWGFSIYRTAGKGMKGCADFPDLGGGRMGIPSFPEDHRWLRIVRRGQRFQAFTSANGAVWQKAMERISKKFNDEQYVGVCFRAVPGKGRGVFQGTLDNMTLERGKVPAELRGKPRQSDLHLDGRITALVQAPADPDLLLARSPTQGLLKSTDRGDTWKPCNGNLTTVAALAVRSVAVHPADSSIVLRAGGTIVGGTLRSGLWRSKDGGDTWRLVTPEIDFDGSGPTTLFGEVLAFCPEDPNLVLAGGETTGVFLSRDAGVTWAPAGLAGERITCLAFSPGTSTPIVGTFADSEFEALALGVPAVPLNTPGGIYRGELKNDKLRFSEACRVNAFGVVNIGAGTHPNFSTYATTRGVYYTWQRDNAFSQRRYNLPADTLFTALGYRTYMKETRPNEQRLKVDTYAAPFSGETPHPIHRVPERTTGKWAVLSDEATIDGEAAALDLHSGISCLLPDASDAKTLFLCNVHGIFKSTDQGRTWVRVLASTANK